MRHITAAIKEFAGRYGETFKAAWSVRITLDPPKRSEDELAFLPAHLELIATPVSPASRWIMRTIIAFFCVALIWAIFGKLDRSEEHTSELQSLMRISYAVFCL